MTDLASHLGRVMTRETTLTHVMLYTYYGAASVKRMDPVFFGGGGEERIFLWLYFGPAQKQWQDAGLGWARTNAWRWREGTTALPTRNPVSFCVWLKKKRERERPGTAAPSGYTRTHAVAAGPEHSGARQTGAGTGTGTRTGASEKGNVEEQQVGLVKIDIWRGYGGFVPRLK